MGNADLRSIAVVEDAPFEGLAGSTVAVDAHLWLYRYLTTTVKFTADGVYTTDDGTEVANLIGLVQGLPKFFEHDIVPVFVFDGGVTDLKAAEVERRRERRADAEQRRAAAEARGDDAEAARLEARTQRLTDAIHETSRDLLGLLDVPVVEAPAEGEAQCAHMAAVGDVDYAGSEDYDTMLFGAPRTLRGLTSSGDPELLELAATLAEHDFTREQLVDTAILMGTDFNDGIDGFGPATATKAVREHGDLFAVLDAEGECVPDGERIRDLFLEPPATDAYDAAFETPDPDVAAAREYVTERWEIPADEVARGFERIESALVQTGLDEWT